MQKISGTTNILCLLAFAGCSTPPTLDERMNSKYASINDVDTNVADEMRYRVGYQYANSARTLIADPDVPTVTSLDYSLQDTYDSVIDNWPKFPAQAAPSSRVEVRNRTYFMLGLGMIAQPNTHYILFEEGQGTASAEDIDVAWNAAYALFSKIHNRDNNCEMPRWSPRSYNSAMQPKNVRGIYKQAVFYCPNPAAVGETQTVRVEAWANPFDGVRTMGAVQAECWYRPPRGQQFTDVRACGESLARRQRALIPESQFDLMELITTPRQDNPSVFKVVARYKSKSVALSAPETNPDYVAFLEQQPYEPE